MNKRTEVLKIISGIQKIRKSRITNGMNNKDRMKIEGMKMSFKAGVKEVFKSELKDAEFQRKARTIDNIMDQV
tara:strand:- start:181 stop:399 length:219 start_codon:yes stop_codon:yes gene_type:complete